MFSKIAELKKWSTEEQIDILLTYIDRQDSADAFYDYLNEQPASKSQCMPTVYQVETLLTELPLRKPKAFETHTFTTEDDAWKMAYGVALDFASSQGILGELAEAFGATGSLLSEADDSLILNAFRRFPEDQYEDIIDYVVDTLQSGDMTACVIRVSKLGNDHVRGSYAQLLACELVPPTR